MDKPTCLIIQTGAMGDIFILAPIAKFYADKGYTVFWPTRAEYSTFIKNYLPYVNGGEMNLENYPELHSDWLRSDTMNLKKMTETFNYDLIVDTSDRDEFPNEQPEENFEQYKYRIAGVPFALKHHLNFDRDIEKEERLKIIIEHDYNINIEKDKYAVCHLESSHGDQAKEPDSIIYPKVFITEIEGFEIADWFPIIAKAKEVYAVESAVHQFIDGAYHRIKTENKDIKLFLLSRSSLSQGESYTISKYWGRKYMK